MGEALRSSAILDIYCASCGAPAFFDIPAQTYRCRFCGAQTGIREALETKKRFRSLHRAERGTAPSFRMASASCKSCGAEIVFEENEALTSCAFCGKSLVRRDYLKTDEFPELLIPFRLTPEQAKAELRAWCEANRRRAEAKQLLKHIDGLQGFYLPYQLVKGPTRCAVQRESTRRVYDCRGLVDGMFVNTTKNVNNLVLNGTEPYDLTDLRDFDFAYLAGQRVRMADLSGEEAEARVAAELRSEYEPFICDVMETRAVSIRPDTGGLLSMSVLLPAYWLRAGDVPAAVNGQTGKVAVQERKDRFLLPWWLKPIAGTLLFTALIFFISWLISRDAAISAYISGLMSVFLAVVLFTAYHDEYAGSTRWKLRRRILTSTKLQVPIPEPAFYESVGGQDLPVLPLFTTPGRLLRAVLLGFATVFLPVLIGFVLNGFSFRGLTLGGAAVWMCIFVPLTPVFLIKFGRLELYEHPHLYALRPNGRRYRVRKPRDLKQALRTLKENFSIGWLLLGGGILLVLAINVLLVLRWDDF